MKKWSLYVFLIVFIIVSIPGGVKIYNIIHTKKSVPTESGEELSIIDLNETKEKRLMKQVISASPKIISSRGSGTGFLFSKNGLIVTALHVVGSDNTVTVKFFEIDDDYNIITERVSTTGFVVGWSDASIDLVFIKIYDVPSGLEPLAAASAESLLLDQPIWRFGYGSNYKWAYGQYLPTHCEGDKTKRQSIIIPVEPGASGGPIVNGLGEVIGITQFYYNDKDDLITTEENLIRKYKYEPSRALFLPITYITDFIALKNIE